MNSMNQTLVLFFLFSALQLFFCESDKNRTDKIDNSHVKLWYKQPAQKWLEALPVGNGRLGAMVFGEVYQERIQQLQNY